MEIHSNLFSHTFLAAGLRRDLFFQVQFRCRATPALRTEREKTVNAAEVEGALVIYMTQSLEPVFRDRLGLLRQRN